MRKLAYHTEIISQVCLRISQIHQSSYQPLISLFITLASREEEIYNYTNQITITLGNNQEDLLRKRRPIGK